MGNVGAMHGVNIFKDGLPERETPNNSEELQPQMTPTKSQPGEEPKEQAIRSGTELQQNAKKAKETILRSYYLPANLIQRLDDAHMIYQLKKQDKDKQDIVAEALHNHLNTLEKEGFFEILQILQR